MNFLLPEFLNTGKTGPGVGGETCYLLLGFKGNGNLPRNQNKFDQSESGIADKARREPQARRMTVKANQQK